MLHTIILGNQEISKEQKLDQGETDALVGLTRGETPITLGLQLPKHIEQKLHKVKPRTQNSCGGGLVGTEKPGTTLASS